MPLSTLLHSEASHVIELHDDCVSPLSFTLEEVDDFLEVLLSLLEVLLLLSQWQQPILRTALLNCVETGELLMVVLFLLDISQSLIVKLQVRLVEHASDDAIECVMELNRP